MAKILVFHKINFVRQ